jgi:hypothetical protein
MSALLAETFIQHLEHTIISKILNKYPIINHHTYVDVLIIYNKQTNTNDVLN